MKIPGKVCSPLSLSRGALLIGRIQTNAGAHRGLPVPGIFTPGSVNFR
jgi:hypothetical protein